MVIYTPRLCNDVAFLPPKASIPHEIFCKAVIPASQVEEWDDYLRQKQELLIARGGKVIDDVQGADGSVEPSEIEGRTVTPRVGGVQIGGRTLIPSGVTLKKSGVVGGKPLETFIATLASSANPDEKLSQSQLKKLKINDAPAVEKLKKDLKKLAGTRGWKLEVVDTVAGREVRGVIEEGRKEDEKAPKGESKTEAEEDTTEGSEETYKEEL